MISQSSIVPRLHEMTFLKRPTKPRNTRTKMTDNQIQTLTFHHRFQTGLEATMTMIKARPEFRVDWDGDGPTHEILPEYFAWMEVCQQQAADQFGQSRLYLVPSPHGIIHRWFRPSRVSG